MLKLKEEVEPILKQVGLTKIKFRYDYSPRYSRVIASVNYDRHLLEITGVRLIIGDKFLEYNENIRHRILQHEVAHVYDAYYNKRNSKHDKIFKDLCEGLYGDRTIGQATIKGWE